MVGIPETFDRNYSEEMYSRVEPKSVNFKGELQTFTISLLPFIMKIRYPVTVRSRVEVDEIASDVCYHNEVNSIVLDPGIVPVVSTCING